MMVHPFPETYLRPISNSLKDILARFTAHAAAYPWGGINVLDAAVLAYNSMSVL